jgi:hypothetical protein
VLTALVIKQLAMKAPVEAPTTPEDVTCDRDKLPLTCTLRREHPWEAVHNISPPLGIVAKFSADLQKLFRAPVQTSSLP